MPLYIVEALVVEAVALRVSSDRPLAFGLWSGLGIGTVGLASEWAWSHFWMPIPWPAAAFPEVVLAGPGDRRCRRRCSAPGSAPGSRPSRAGACPGLRLGACAGAATIAVATVFALNTPADEGVQAQVALHDVSGGPQREVERDGHADPARRRRGRALVRRHRLAGRRPRRRPARARRPGHLPHHRADPGRRQLEDDGPPAQRQLADRGADLPAPRRRDPGARSPRPGELQPRLRRRDAAAAAREDRRLPGPRRDRLRDGGGHLPLAPGPARLEPAPPRLPAAAGRAPQPRQGRRPSSTPALQR